MFDTEHLGNWGRNCGHLGDIEEELRREGGEERMFESALYTPACIQQVHDS